MSGDYSSRTLPVITLVSPKLTKIVAKWADDERSYAKVVQRDKYPLLHGETAIDFGGGADGYNFTVIFDGPNCDLAANQFYECAKELGPWTVIHPVHGAVQLQLLSLKHTVAPVQSGGRVEVATEWMEPLDPYMMMTVRQIAGMIDAQLAALSAASAAAFAGASVVSGFGSLSTIATVAGIASAAANKIADKINYAMTVSECQEIADEQTAAAQSTLTNSTDAMLADSSAFDPGTIAASIHTALQGPVLAGTDPSTSISVVSAQLAEFAAMLPSGTSATDLNRAQTTEVTLEAALGAACLAATVGEFKTRNQAIESARALVEMLHDITEALDDCYEAFADEVLPSRRYYAQTETYEAALLLVSQTVEYLIRLSFDLRVEKTMTLDRDKSPIQIVTEEFGVKGEDSLDDFIAWNELEGDDVMLLDAGREVVVYMEMVR